MDREKLKEATDRYLTLIIASELDDVDTSPSTITAREKEMEKLVAVLGEKRIIQATQRANKILEQSTHYTSGAPYKVFRANERAKMANKRNTSTENYENAVNTVLGALYGVYIYREDELPPGVTEGSQNKYIVCTDVSRQRTNWKNLVIKGSQTFNGAVENAIGALKLDRQEINAALKLRGFALAEIEKKASVISSRRPATRRPGMGV